MERAGKSCSVGRQSSPYLLAATRGCCSLSLGDASGRETTCQTAVLWLQQVSISAGFSSSREGLLPAGPEAEITFCCAETAGAQSQLQPAVSLCVPPPVPLGTVSVFGRHRWGETVYCCEVGKWHKAVTGPILQGLHLHNHWPSTGRWWKRSRRASIDHQDLLPPTQVTDLLVATCLCSTKWFLLPEGSFPFLPFTEVCFGRDHGL